MSASAISGVLGERLARVSALARMSFRVQIPKSAWPCTEAAVPAPVYYILAFILILFTDTFIGGGGAYHVQGIKAYGQGNPGRYSIVDTRGGNEAIGLL